MREMSPAESRRSSDLFGIHSESKAMQQLKTVRLQNRRFTFIAATFIFLLVITLICLIVFDMFNSSKIHRISAQENLSRFDQLPVMKAAQHWRAVEDVTLSSPELQDVEELAGTERPEGAAFDDEIDRQWKDEQNATERHSNHQYSEQQINLPEEEVEHTPRPFMFDTNSLLENYNGATVHEEAPTLYGLQNAYRPPDLRHDQPIPAEAEDFRPVTNYHAFKLQQKIPKGPPPGFKPPMHFKGVFMRPRDKNSFDDGRNDEYYKKINDYFGKFKDIQNKTNKPTGMESSDKDPQSLNEKSELSQIEVPLHGSQVADRLSMHQHQGQHAVGKARGKPFTVMLDIYPMDSEDGGTNLIGGQRPRDTIFIPVQNNGQFLQPQGSASHLMTQAIKYIPSHPAKLHYPPGPVSKRKNRMIMKLNLFPRKQQQLRRTWNILQRQEDYDDVDDNDDGIDGEGDDDDSNDHQCHGIVGHNPYGKPITAKWKDKHGNIVHAKYVALKQWDRADNSFPDDNDYDDPR